MLLTLYSVFEFYHKLERGLKADSVCSVLEMESDCSSDDSGIYRIIHIFRWTEMLNSSFACQYINSLVLDHFLGGSFPS